ncbi:venom protein 302-like [Oratosquilla oratoria]|uniref:venom protein 302-like n=1 Tax=Oratosquilla oratoria TaxID=337810 RepID=UPI003F7721D3
MLGLRFHLLGVLLAFVLLTTVDRSTALRCDCRKFECPPLDVTKCKAGVGRYYCSCCDRCLKAENETCGKAFNREGRCGEGLFCDNNDDQNTVGICRRTLVFPEKK